MRKPRVIALALALALAIGGCDAGGGEKEPAKANGPSNAYYEIFVRSFADSNGDGIGDLNGVTSKLDYLDSLGVDGIWLMPIMPSPSYHGYDVTDYYGVNPDYGTLDDFDRLVAEAHKKGISVILDLVVNHTSVRHPWFVDSASGPDTAHRGWYSWASDRGGANPPAGALGTAWHGRGNDEYLGVFWEGMPDLNFDNADVRKEMVAVGQFWLKRGADGFRLDAAKHIYGDFASTINSDKVKAANKAWWQEFREGLDAVKPGAYLVGEVWDATAVIGPYLDHALDSAFNFDLAEKLVSAADSEKAQDFGFTVSRVHDYYAKASGGSAVDALFLTNHDQNRVMTAMRGNLDHAKTAAALLLTLPGNAFLYYGEELGMTGAKPDERIREPFPWTVAPGGDPAETTWEAAQGRGDGQASVEAEDEDAGSLLNRYRLLLSWRSRMPALRGGTIASYATDNGAVEAYVRKAEEQTLLVAHNLSGKPQTLTLRETAARPRFAKLALSTSDEASLDGQTLTLSPYTSVVLTP